MLEQEILDVINKNLPQQLAGSLKKRIEELESKEKELEEVKKQNKKLDIENEKLLANEYEIKEGVKYIEEQRLINIDVNKVLNEREIDIRIKEAVLEERDRREYIIIDALSIPFKNRVFREETMKAIAVENSGHTEVDYNSNQKVAVRGGQSIEDKKETKEVTEL